MRIWKPHITGHTQYIGFLFLLGWCARYTWIVAYVTMNFRITYSFSSNAHLDMLLCILELRILLVELLVTS